VSVFAVGIDALTLWATFALGPGAPAPTRRRGWIVVTFGAMLILGAGLWFVALQFVAVGICPYCMAAHGAGVVAALLLLSCAARPEGAGKALFQSTGYAAAAALAALFLGQILHTPKTGRETRDFAVGSNAQAFLAAQSQAASKLKTNEETISAAPVQAASSNNAPPMPGTNVLATSATNVPLVPGTNTAPLQVFTPGMKPVQAMRRPFKTYGGMVALDLAEVPLLGSETNEYAIVSLFDYTCHHCRLMHPVLTEVQSAFKDRLSVISLPMPLDPRCNQTVTHTHPDHSNACVYAHIALALFRADRAKHHEFDEWLFTGERPPPMAQVVARAAGLVGTNVLAQALRDPWVAEQIQFDVAIYEIAYRQQRGAMPQLIIGNTVAEGAYSREGLIKLLEVHLGLKQTP
jgi:protein-disulfide isomerase